MNLTSSVDHQASVSGRKPLPVRPGMFLETVSKVMVVILFLSSYF